MTTDDERARDRRISLADRYARMAETLWFQQAHRGKPAHHCEIPANCPWCREEAMAEGQAQLTRRLRQLEAVAVAARAAHESLEELVDPCSCHEDYTSRKLRDPGCGYHDYGHIVEEIRAALRRALEALEKEGP